MATISGITACSGGDHLTGTITLASGATRTFSTSLTELRIVLDEVDKREFILRQVGAIVRDNPNDTPAQRKTRIQSTTFLE